MRFRLQYSVFSLYSSNCGYYCPVIFILTILIKSLTQCLVFLSP